MAAAWESAPIEGAAKPTKQPAWMAAPVEGAAAPEPTIGQQVKQGAGNLIAGAVRGAGSIGATILAPYDMVMDKIDPQTSITSLVTGKKTPTRNEQRRADMDAALAEMGAEPDSLLYKGGKLGGEIAGTAGVGGTLAKGLQAIPAVAKYAPGVVEAVRTSGMTAGAAKAGIPGTLANLGTRTLGGAVTGGASAALVNPEDAATGATIGALLPGSLAVAGGIGKTLGKVARGPEQAPEMAAAVKAARAAGYVIPPTQANPTLGNRLLEGMSGKITTAQNASAANQATTGKLAARAVGLAEDAPITPEALDAVRAEAGKAYGAIAKLGKFDATGVKLPQGVQVEEGVSALMPGAKTRIVDSAEVVNAWKQANHDATAYYRAYGRDANPETLAKAKAAAGAAKAIDDFMAEQVKKLGQPELLDALKEARVRIAKTYSVESAMNPLTGTIDARKLAKQLEKGKVLSGDLLTAANFAARFPKAAQTVEGMGSLPQTSPLDWTAGFGMSAVTANPLGMAAVAARPAARALTLSDLVQNRLVQQGPSRLSSLLANPDAQQALYRAAPVASVSR